MWERGVFGMGELRRENGRKEGRDEVQSRNGKEDEKIRKKGG